MNQLIGRTEKYNIDKANNVIGEINKFMTEMSKTHTEKSGSEKSNSEKSNTEKSSTEKSNTEKSGSEKSGSEKSGSEKSGSEKSGSEKSGSEKSSTEKSSFGRRTERSSFGRRTEKSIGTVSDDESPINMKYVIEEDSDCEDVSKNNIPKKYIESYGFSDPTEVIVTEVKPIKPIILTTKKPKQMKQIEPTELKNISTETILNEIALLSPKLETSSSKLETSSSKLENHKDKSLHKQQSLKKSKMSQEKQSKMSQEKQSKMSQEKQSKIAPKKQKIQETEYSEYMEDVSEITKTFSKKIVNDVKENFDVAHSYINDNKNEIIIDTINYIVIVIELANKLVLSAVSYLNTKLFDKNDSIFLIFYNYFQIIGNFFLKKVSDETLKQLFESKYQLVSFWKLYTHETNETNKRKMLENYLSKHNRQYDDLDDMTFDKLMQYFKM